MFFVKWYWCRSLCRILVAMKLCWFLEIVIMTKFESGIYDSRFFGRILKG